MPDDEKKQTEADDEKKQTEADDEGAAPAGPYVGKADRETETDAEDGDD